MAKTTEQLKAENEALKAEKEALKAKLAAKENGEYDNTNKGALWINTNKNIKRDYRGELDVEGVRYWVSGWKVYSDNPSAPVIRLAIKPVEEE